VKVEVRGYSRDCGTIVLMDADLEDLQLPRRLEWFRNEAVSVRRSRRRVRANKAPVRLTLNGRYHVSVELSKEEVRNLFLQMYGDDLAEAFMGLAAIVESRTASEEEADD